MFQLHLECWLIILSWGSSSSPGGTTTPRVAMRSQIVSQFFFFARQRHIVLQYNHNTRPTVAFIFFRRVRHVASSHSGSWSPPRRCPLARCQTTDISASTLPGIGRACWWSRMPRHVQGNALSIGWHACARMGEAAAAIYSITYYLTLYRSFI